MMVSFKHTNLGLLSKYSDASFSRNKVYPVKGVDTLEEGPAIVVIDDVGGPHYLTDEYVENHFEWVLTS